MKWLLVLLVAILAFAGNFQGLEAASPFARAAASIKPKAAAKSAVDRVRSPETVAKVAALKRARSQGVRASKPGQKQGPKGAAPNVRAAVVKQLAAIDKRMKSEVAAAPTSAKDMLEERKKNIAAAAKNIKVEALKKKAGRVTKASKQAHNKDIRRTLRVSASTSVPHA